MLTIGSNMEIKDSIYRQNQDKIMVLQCVIGKKSQISREHQHIQPYLIIIKFISVSFTTGIKPVNNIIFVSMKVTS